MSAVTAIMVLTALALAPDDVRHRMEVRKAFADPAKFEENVKKGLADADPMVRRYALYWLSEKDRPRAVEAAKAFLDDPSVAVRLVAKSLNRTGGLYRENRPLSTDVGNDHMTERVLTVRPKKGKFAFEGGLPKCDAVEFWFGKQKQDLYVWLNDVYLGQYDRDSMAGREFRLDATAECRKSGPNAIAVKNARGEACSVSCTVEVLVFK